MNDKELTELAAKAFGVAAEGFSPLTDDGDALRLAVKLNISVNVSTPRGTSWTNNQRGDLTAEVLHDDAVNFDPYAAARRAIVRAAVESRKEQPT